MNVRMGLKVSTYGTLHDIHTVEQAKFASVYISRIRDLVSHSRSYRTRSIGCLVMLSTTGGDGASVGEFQSRRSWLKSRKKVQ